MANHIVGIGEILWDVFPDQERFGGAPCNFACSVSELAGNDATVNFVGAVGRDSYGTRGIESLQIHGVDTSYVQTQHASTGRVTVKLDEWGVASYAFDPESAWDHLHWSESLDKLAQSCDAVCFGTLGQRGDLTRSTIRQFLNSVPPTAQKVLDINLRAPYFDDILIRDSLKLANVLKLNDAELPIVAAACDCHGSDAEILHQLIEKYRLNSLALTRGEAGAVLFSQGKWSDLPGRIVKVADTVGAGDAYTAALVLGLIAGEDVESTNRKAIEVASYVCSQAGATMPFPFSYKDLKR